MFILIYELFLLFVELPIVIILILVFQISGEVGVVIRIRTIISKEFTSSFESKMEINLRNTLFGCILKLFKWLTTYG